MDYSPLLSDLFGEKVLISFKRGFFVGFLDRSQFGWRIKGENGTGSVTFQNEEIEWIDLKTKEIQVKD